ncbi:hypothetical protein [Mycobacterium sp. SMC-4]|uniref:hypothetical protein n=1 Tax=Mycobacterium sp. SMC-4 TaxID=2857059 RepID=UPI0021B28EDD|nr:hypothetical protein [Mycobacterium sp. SMC-4]UXA18982.1 hypothetical protein KXD98_04720 [Mycobacterium sp. SMC-4]
MGTQRPLLADIMAVIGIAALYHAHVRPWMFRWGARDDEVAAHLPGDELVDPRGPRTTRAVTIDASPGEVWPWLAQIGEDRAGFYSYSVLERAALADIHNASAIHPEWQQIEVGDTVWLARRYGPRARQIVAAVEPRSHLVLVSPADYERLQRGEKASGCWSFTLRREVGWTRLVVRGSGGPVGRFWFDIPHFVMEQKMMRGIADRAQRARRQVIAASIARHPSHAPPDRPRTTSTGR